MGDAGDPTVMPKRLARVTSGPLPPPALLGAPGHTDLGLRPLSAPALERTLIG